MVKVVLSRVREVTGVTFSLTTMSQFALMPLALVAVMTALPAEIPSTMPSIVTEATLGRLLAQVIFLFVAFDGETVALSDFWSPTVNSRLDVDSLMDSTTISAGSFGVQEKRLHSTRRAAKSLNSVTFIVVVSAIQLQK